MRREARRRKAFVADVRPLEIFERDGWVCGICGDIVTPKDASIDHVIPFARGGTHEPANVQTAHHLCNSRKGARLPEEYVPA
jgi:5-methylcytosine-specific restriction endonuclease McrA